MEHQPEEFSSAKNQNAPHIPPEGREKSSPNKKALWKKRGRNTVIVLALTLSGLFLWKEWAEGSARWVPEYTQEILPTWDGKRDLSPEEEAFYLAQTGLSFVGLERLAEANRLGELGEFQEAFFTPAVLIEEGDSLDVEGYPMLCFQNSPISWEELLLNQQGERGVIQPMVPLEVGDILLTPNSRCFGWRQGHAALVVEAEEGITLESVVLGQNSITQWAEKWQGFPAVVILRATDPTLGQVATTYAMTYLADIPYDLTVGVLSAKHQKETQISGTQCAHLVWQAYQWAGIDLDSNGGIIVTPQNLAQAPGLEVVQVWGLSPDVLW